MEIARQNGELSKLDKLKDQFLANTSHELRTPLNGIVGIAESLIDGATGPLSPATIKNLQMIVDSGRRLTTLIGDILDFSQIKSDKLSLHRDSVYIQQITDLVIGLTRPLIGKRPVQLINAIDPDLPPVYGDDQRIEQIMFNLIGNAVKFTNEGQVVIKGRDLGHAIEIEVADTGIGIPADRLEDIFTSFEQIESSNNRQYQGAGLGLSITRRLVELHGGSIHVDSQLDHGSVFRFTLPKGKIKAEKKTDTERILSRIRQEEDRELDEMIIPSAAPLRKYSILVVDDEPVNLQVLSNHLELNQYEVRTAADGAEALDLIEKEGQPNLIILDVMMPGMSGFEVCKKIRQPYPAGKLPIILLTAKDRISDLTEGFNAGANDYLVKPFSKRELLTRIKTHLSLALINKAYGRFVPNEFIKFLNKESIVDVELGDQTQNEMTVLFADIRDFTSLSERMTPKENFDFLNGYLEQIGPIIRSHHGFIDKYIGDAIMALFPDKTDDAVRAAIAIKDHVRKYNIQQKAKGAPEIRIGIGVHTGPMILGTIGEKERLESTVISDSVNLAARLEELTKTYGVSFLISQSAFNRLPSGIGVSARKLDRVQVRGKEKYVTIVEIFSGEEVAIQALKEASRPAYEAGLNHIIAGQIKEAKADFQQALTIYPEDPAAQRYFRYCERLESYGFPDDWRSIPSSKG